MDFVLFFLFRMNQSNVSRILLLTDNDDEDEFLEILQLLPIKRKSTRAMILNRESEGAFNLLIKKYLMTEEDSFAKFFRITPHLFYKLLNKISSDITTLPYNRNPNPITAEQKLCLTLRLFFSAFQYFSIPHMFTISNFFNSRFLATGETQESLSYLFRISRTWIGKILKEVIVAIKKRMFTALPQPTNEKLIQNGQEFGKRWNFPNVMGCLDGKHVRVRCPNSSGSLYYNYKDFFSVVLMALVGPNFEFMAIDVGSFGREGDSGANKCCCFSNINEF